MDIDIVLDRIRQLKEVKTKKEIAELLGISPNDFYNREKKGTLLTAIIKWADQEGLDLGWLLTQRKENEAPMMMARFEMSTQPLFLSIEEAQHIGMLRKIAPKKRKNIMDRTRVAFVEECGREV